MVHDSHNHRIPIIDAGSRSVVRTNALAHLLLTCIVSRSIIKADLVERILCAEYMDALRHPYHLDVPSLLPTSRKSLTSGCEDRRGGSHIKDKRS